MLTVSPGYQEPRPSERFQSFEGNRPGRAAHGTARSLLKNLHYSIAGKTGTAQVVGIKQDEEYDSEALKERQRDHAWFMAFAPVDDPQIAIAVIVENGESSGRTAAPIAQGIINRYLEDKVQDGR